MRLYREVYFDLSIRHFHEKLRGKHNIELSYTWVQLWRCRELAWWRSGASGVRIGGGARGGLCPVCCCTSMASKHQWLNDDRWHDLVVILDDATTEIYYAQLVAEEVGAGR